MNDDAVAEPVHVVLWPSGLGGHCRGQLCDLGLVPDLLPKLSCVLVLTAFFSSKNAVKILTTRSSNVLVYMRRGLQVHPNGRDGQVVRVSRLQLLFVGRIC